MLLVPALGVGLLVTAFIVNVLGNRFIGTLSTVAAAIKILGIVAFAVAGLWVAGISFEGMGVTERSGVGSFLSATALALLAYKGFTTITNSGSEIVDPQKNIGRSIIISLVICLIVYMLVALAVASNLSVSEIIDHRDYALAESGPPGIRLVRHLFHRNSRNCRYDLGIDCQHICRIPNACDAERDGTGAPSPLRHAR